MSYLQTLLGEAYKEGMTVEEISNALESKQVEVKKELPKIEESGEYQSLKKAFDKASAEVSKYKKELQDKMTDDEKARVQTQELLSQLKAENESMKKQMSITDNKAKLVAIGYPEDLANATAEAMVNGDMETVMSNQKAMLDAREQAIRADVLRETPLPPAGQNGSPAIDKAKFEKMTIAERTELFQNDPELYERLKGD